MPCLVLPPACMLHHFSHVQLFATLCSLPNSSVHGIFQARILEWVVMPFSKGSSQPRDRTRSLMFPALADGFFTTRATWKAPLSPHRLPVLYCFDYILLNMFIFMEYINCHQLCKSEHINIGDIWNSLFHENSPSYHSHNPC